MNTWLRRLLIGSALLVLLLLIAFQVAVRTLRAQVEGALGPRGEVARIEVGLRAVVLHDLKIRADREEPDTVASRRRTACAAGGGGTAGARPAVSQGAYRTHRGGRRLSVHAPHP
jgi:hypothetical protein